jgi:UDP-N-acetylglucosamine 2-epimerase (non-hydrolysing)
MKIMSVVGARPNFMKAAPILSAVRKHNNRVASSTAAEVIQHVLVHTGQHYDQLMSDSFFADLELPKPDAHLGVGSGSHAAQTAEIMRRFEPVLLEERPDVLLVVGDVNSTVGCALVAAKVSFDDAGTRPLIAHIEAGLRSFDRSMPEEINRIVTDHLSDLLFVTEESGLRNLANEGIPATKIHLVGNTMIDSLLACKAKATSSNILDILCLHGRDSGDGAILPTSQYALLTLHRPANVDNKAVFMNILRGLEDLIREYVVVFPAHPRTQNRIREFGLEDRFEWTHVGHQGTATSGPRRRNAVRMTDPLGYLDFLCLMSNATLVVTDSGGIQEETTCLGVPCVTVRENTERPVTVEVGTNVMGGIHQQGIRSAIRQQLACRGKGSIPEKWDGKTAERIIAILAHTSVAPFPNLQAPVEIHR